jgi:hypothetical protein
MLSKFRNSATAHNHKKHQEHFYARKNGNVLKIRKIICTFHSHSMAAREKIIILWKLNNAPDNHSKAHTTIVPILQQLIIPKHTQTFTLQ